MRESAFDCVVVPEYPSKPRNSGVTMVIDYGITMPAQQGLLHAAGSFVDLAKMATGVPHVLPPQVVKDKIELYKQNGVSVFPGGQLFEIAIMQRRVERYFDAVKSIGFTHVEISDTCLDITPEAKAGYIRTAVGMGLKVMGEVGKKVAASDADALARDVEGLLEAGAWKVFVEAGEFLHQQSNKQFAEGLVTRVDPSFLMFETPGQWFPGVTFQVQFDLWRWLLATFGPDVNIANVPPDEVVRLTCLRLGIGADPTLEKGTFVMSQRGLLP